MDNKLRVYILCRYAIDSSLYSSWISRLPYDVEIVEACSIDFVPPNDCGLVITHDHYHWEEVSALRRIYEQRLVPTLVLADGILEYRNTWENPSIPDGSLYQPLLADKIACLGRHSARMIESWSNVGKTEIVGLPRLDAYINCRVPGPSDARFRLVIATANTPAFTAQQRECVVRSLVAIKNKVESAKWKEREIEVNWRLTAGLDSEIGLKVEAKEPLLDAIQSCDAVITTPSTIFLESILLGKPTAVLDYSNAPQFTPCAWHISTDEQIEFTLRELADPPAGKQVYQEFVLRENLECQTPAIPRMVELVGRMVEIGAVCRANRQPLVLPDRILPPSKDGGVAELDLAKAFGSNPSFQVSEVQRLQAELSQATHRLGTLPQELVEKNTQIAQLQDALDESRRRLADVRARLFKLRKILGIGKENQTED